MAFSGKRVLVTGSSRGIGQATARLFCESGAQVAVNGRTPDSTAAGMAALGEARITEIVRPVGLGPSKARNIVKLSAVLLAEHGGAVPCSAAEMRRLPGIGRKSAEVTANFAFHEPVIAVDTHIFRISNRIPLAPGPTVDAVADGLARIVPDAFKDNAHVWLFRHGRDICTARNPACPRCPVSDLCAWPSKATA